MQNKAAQQLQQVITDNLFPEVHHISDVKQVLEEIKRNAQELQNEQIKGILLLKHLGTNTYLHEKNPYENLIKFISGEGKELVANPDYYIETIEALIPKPPKPIVLAEKDKGGKK